MVAAAQTGSPVLLVGDVGAQLALELASKGLLTATAGNANDAVARMKSTRFPYVVVPPILVDMGGIDFIHGVLRHFDANVVLYGNGIESSEINALLRTGRVAHFPAHADGHVVADFLARRAAGSTSSPPTPVPGSTPPRQTVTSPPPLAGPIPGASGPPSFNLTPGVPSNALPVTTTPLPSLSAQLFGSVASTFPQAGSPVPTPMPAKSPIPTGAPGFSSSPMGAGAQFEQVIDELARANSELVVLRNKLQAADQEKLSLVAEVEAARRSAIADVAQVMALSDEGDPVAAELEEIKEKLAVVEKERDEKAQEADGLRRDRDNLVGEIAEKAQKIAAERARADAAESAADELKKQSDEAKGDADRLRMDIEKANADLLTARRELDDEQKALEEMEASLIAAQKAKADAENAALAQASDTASALEKEKAEAIERLEKQRTDDVAAFELRVVEGEKRIATLEAQRAELAAALDKKQQETSGKSDAEAALRLELEKMRTDVNTARADATTVRLDLQEALMRLDEAAQTLATLTQERDALRAEAGPLRDWANQVVAQQQQQQGELDRLRALVDAAESRGKMIAELQAQIDKLQTERDKARASGSGAASADVEVVIARSRQLADLVRALEPFMWGLTQATGFYTKAGIAGGDGHLKLLQQLQGVLLRLRDEIAMLDLS